MQGRTRRTLIHTADAQASVLGFVIILGILLAATSLYLGFNVPKWTAEYEFAHEAKVERDFSDLSAAIDLALVSEAPTASSSIAIGMAPERVQLVGIFASGGTLQFDPENERFACIAALPNETAVNESGVSPWNSTDVNFPYYDKFHLDIFLGEGAKLQLEAGQNKIFDSGGNETLNGEYWYNNFTVTNGTILHTHWLAIHAINITIGPNSSIVADGGGLFGGKYNEDGKGEGGGHAATSSHYSVGGGGAGFGGAGGNGGSSYYGTGGQGGSTFGNETGVALDAGSGGGGGNLGYQTAFGSYVGGNGGEGGGVVFLDAPLITLYGNVSANGDDGKVGSHNAVDSAGGGGGGGSGGTILIKGGNITLHGMLSVRGGDGFDGSTACDYDSVRNNNGGGGGGGGGGRIKIFNRTALVTLEPDWHDHTDVRGGAGGLGGVGWRNASDPDCPGGSPQPPYPGGNGSHGNNGTASPPMHINYTESIPHYPSGYLISNVTATNGSIGYHASNTSMIRYGTMTWGEYTPSGTNIALKVRTAMDANMTDALPWEECPEVTMGQNIADLPSVSDGHRYIQWRAELVTMDRSRTPTLKWVNISCEYGPPILMNATGNIEFGSQYLYYPDYKLIYEHGAIIKEPSQGKEFMLFPPPLIISQDTNNCTSLKISALNLIGNASSSSGAFSSSIDAYYQSSALRKGGLTSGLAYGNLTLTLTTEHSTAWKNWFNKTCKDAGLTRGNTTAGDYYFNEPGNNTLNVIFTGTESKPVYLWLKYADARIEIPKLPKRA
jgi:hypothetical protein